jgi:hypothetical protein
MNQIVRDSTRGSHASEIMILPMLIALGTSFALTSVIVVAFYMVFPLPTTCKTILLVPKET